GTGPWRRIAADVPLEATGKEAGAPVATLPTAETTRDTADVVAGVVFLPRLELGGTGFASRLMGAEFAAARALTQPGRGRTRASNRPPGPPPGSDYACLHPRGERRTHCSSAWRRVAPSCP